MATFNAKGIEGLSLSMQEFAEIPDDVVEEMLTEAGKVVVAAHRRSISTLGLVKSRKLLDSVSAISKAGSARNDWQRYVLVYPKGNHGTRNRRRVTKQYSRSKHGSTYTVGGDTKIVTNSEVGYVHEYGAPRRGIAAKHWMDQANEACASAVEQAELAVYDRWLKSKDL